MSQPQYVIVDLKNGLKCEGTLSNIDKVNMKINLLNAKKHVPDVSGKIIEESYESLEINKEDIKEVKLVQYEQKDEKKNINAIPENKLNSLPSNTKPKGYNKEESFFDELSPMTNMEAKNESIKYNDKNAETFNLPANSSELNTNSGRGKRNFNRGGYINRGGYNNRGGYSNRGGGYSNRGGYNNRNRGGNGYISNNNNGYSNSNNGYGNDNGYNGYRNNNDNNGYNNNGYNNQGNFNGPYRGNRGGNRGGFNRGGYQNYQNQGNFSNPNYNNFPNSNANTNPIQGQFQEQNYNNTPNPSKVNNNNLGENNFTAQDGKERSIYDKF